MPNALSADVGLKLGPVLLGTLFKHYLNRVSSSRNASESGHSNSQKQDLLWHEAFQVVKWFMEQSTKHTVEDLQQFANTRIPTPPWIYVERVLIPISVCDVAAIHLIKAFGGEEVMKRVVGGTKWWQVRGIRGVDCQWICQKSHLQKERKVAKSMNTHTQNTERSSAQTSDKPIPKLSKFDTYFSDGKDDKSTETPQKSGQDEHNEDDIDQKITEDAPQGSISYMDGTRCMLYAHGGGYYFGSIDQERYVMQRYARKMNGRVFAVNYRLAPQYPFPCALQDFLAAYIYLINPPLSASHKPISPNLIAFGGDSAGAGLCLAALQVIRDSGLPAPAAAVLVSPWCDLTHSFPSTTQNTATDIIPPYGLSLHKPSVLWPPPTEEISSKVRMSLQERYKKTAKRAVRVANIASRRQDGIDCSIETGVKHVHGQAVAIGGLPDIATARTQTSIPPPVIDVMDPKSGKMVPQALRICGRIPLPWESENFTFELDGKTLQTNNQIQLYCPNNLLLHPLISPILSYLGGLPPLMVIASDKEVLRDEVVHLAHKAAHPERYPASEDAKRIYPPIRNPEMRPTFVHLQIYDAHVLPLFSFITPAKYCYRAIASFMKQFIIPTESPESPESPIITASSLANAENEIDQLETLNQDTAASSLPENSLSSLPPGTVASVTKNDTRDSSKGSEDLAGTKFKSAANEPQRPVTAGDPSVYAGLKACVCFLRWPPYGSMIRERVSFQGIIRQLEPECEIPALLFPFDYTGVFLEPVARRFVEGQALWATKFAAATKAIASERKKNLELARGEALRTIGQFQKHMFCDLEEKQKPNASTRSPPWSMLRRVKTASQVQTNLESGRHNWACSWVLEDEHPPRSSIVSRRDTREARHLAQVADLSAEAGESRLSGNRLWSMLVDFLTTPPYPDRMEEKEEIQVPDDENSLNGVKGNKNCDDSTMHSQIHASEQSLLKGSKIMTRLKSLGKRHSMNTTK